VVPQGGALAEALGVMPRPRRADLEPADAPPRAGHGAEPAAAPRRPPPVARRLDHPRSTIASSLHGGAFSNPRAARRLPGIGAR